ncbi:hypothetical protein [Rossellomorea marisflavi]|uniref:hypothetical protein n=1 Tax=Rossellomorea marisflavi TaxID=189381 RepID=UPI003F9ED3E1
MSKTKPDQPETAPPMMIETVIQIENLFLPLSFSTYDQSDHGEHQEPDAEDRQNHQIVNRVQQSGSSVKPKGKVLGCDSDIRRRHQQDETPPCCTPTLFLYITIKRPPGRILSGGLARFPS